MLNRLLKYCPHCRLRVRLSQRERMGEETRTSRVCNRSKERFLLPGEKVRMRAFNSLPRTDAPRRL